MAISETIINEIVEYYVNLLIIQYNQQPKARAMIDLFVRKLIAEGIIFEIRDGFDLETAVGVQLDILAKYIGADRFYEGQILEDYFAFIEYDTDPVYAVIDRKGYADYTDIGIKVGKWLTYDDILSTTSSLTDSEFRTILKLKILQNNSNHSDQEIIEGVWALFGDQLIPQDNYDMTMNYIVDPAIEPLILVAAEKGILPKPMGVELILITSTA